MTADNNCHEPADRSETGDQNVERLLGHAYHPEAPDADFVRRTEERLLATAQELARTRTAAPDAAALLRLRRRLGWIMAAAAAVVAVGLCLHGSGPGPVVLVPAPHPRERHPATGVAGLTPQRQSAPAPVPSLAPGGTVQTESGQRRRLALPDGSVLYVNELTRIRFEAPRRLELSAGEVFVEVAPHGPETPFIVHTERREVRALGTRFAVRADETGTGVLVTQGHVQVQGHTGVLRAGQQLRPGSDQAIVAPRATHLLAWTKELMTAAEAALVPASKFGGGALVAIDPRGQEARLSLRQYHIDVHIEDGFARTTIDQTYFNHEPQRLEGTFYFPLPPDASLSRLAMYVDGRLMEGGMAERDHARNVFESIKTRMKDPALLEWVDGSTFKMRVFPLEGRQEKRIILSYTQRLPVLYGRMQYRFPAGHSLQTVRDWSFHARIRGGAALTWHCDSHALKAASDGADRLLHAEAKNIKVDRDVVLDMADESVSDEETTRFSTADYEGARYLMVRYRPRLAAAAQRQRRDWVFLFESSGDRDPLLARVQITVLRTLLANAEHDDTFALLTAGTRVRKFAPRAVPATPQNIEAALAFLERAHLIGALDLGQALTAAQPFLKAGTHPYLVHLGSGLAALGERRQDLLVRRIPEGVTYVGIGVGKRWGRSFMKQAAERSDGYFTQINPDEPVAWRAFEVSATLNTPRLLNVKVVDNAERATFHSYATAVAQGEEFCAIARLDAGVPVPQEVTVSGTLDGQPYSRVLRVQNVAPGADYLPRSWAKLEIERLLAENAAGHKDRIVALSKAMYVMTPFTSLLVLENEAMYQQYKVDRGRKDHWALYPCPERIPVVYEPLSGMAAAPNGTGSGPVDVKPSVEQVLLTIVVRGGPQSRAEPDSDRTDRLSEITARRDEPAQASDRELRVVTIKGVDPQLVQQAIDAIQGIRTATGGNLNFFHSGFSGGIGGFGGGGFGGGFQGGFGGFGGGIGGGAISNNGLLRPDGMFGTRAQIPGGFGGGFRNGLGGGFRGLSLTGTASVLPPGINGPASEDFSLWYDLGYLPPVRALVVNGTSRIHANLGGLTQPRFGAPGPDFVNGFTDRSGLLSDLDLATYSKQIHQEMDRKSSYPALATRATLLGEQGLDLSLYQRPAFGGDARVLLDLPRYAPAMNTRPADILAVLDAEAAPDPQVRGGRIDPAARALIDRARGSGWQAWTVPGKVGKDSLTVFFDGTGRHAYERSLPEGLRERVVCDGRNLLHLYPDLFVGARRVVSRHHRAEFTAVVPWVVPPVEDLAWGADVTCLDERTVAITPHGANPVRIELLFAAEGRLAERRLVQLPAQKLLQRETYSADGVVKRLDENDQSRRVVKGVLRPAGAPDLDPDVKKLVVLPFPLRTREHQLTSLALLATEYANQAAPSLAAIIRDQFQARGVRSLGFFTLQKSCEADWDVKELLRAYPDEPVDDRFIAFFNDLAAPRSWTKKAQEGNEFSRAAERQRALEFVRRKQGTRTGWAMLDVLLRQEGDPAWHRELAAACRLFQQTPGLEYAASYERARCLLRAGQIVPARSAFGELYRDTLAGGVLPPLDAAFLHAFQAPNNDPAWAEFKRQTSATLLARKQQPALLALAWQCWQLGQQADAGEFFSQAFTGLSAEEQQTLSLLGLAYLWHTGQYEEAEKLLPPLLADAKLGRDPSLWRLAAAFAARRNAETILVPRLETALDLEYQQLPELIDVEAVRRDYGALLTHYQKRAAALATLHMQPPADFVPRVVRAADRWRTLDSDTQPACQAAANVLAALGEDDRAWEYLTTSIGRQSNEAASWLSLVETLRSQYHLSLADRAYEQAFWAEPTNAKILWGRATNLQELGRPAAARRILRQLADGVWPEQFEPYKASARLELGLP